MAQVQHSSLFDQEVTTSSWAPEINDLQKYRDSLKIMAERVSQAEYLWARSLEPQDLIPQKAPPRHTRKCSRSNRPAPLKRPTTPKRVRTDNGIYSPDPFSLLSPSTLSEDAQSPTSATSCPSPYLRGRRPKRPAEANPSEEDDSSLSPAQLSGTKSREYLRKAENLLNDVTRYVNGLIRDSTGSAASNTKARTGLAAKKRNVMKQVRRTDTQIRALVADARKHSPIVPPDAELFEHPLDKERDSKSSTDSEFFPDLVTQLSTWANAIARVRRDVILDTRYNEDETTSPS